jgi:hypothetical protein
MFRPTRQSSQYPSFPPDTYITDYPIWFRFRSSELFDDALVHTYAGPGLPAMGICQLGNRALPIPDV